MESRKIFLEKNKSVSSVNKTGNIGVDLTSKSRLLPYTDMSDVINLNNLYITERDECNKYRIILTVNPICSNVLFNTRTEIVRKEGSDECELIIGDKKVEKTDSSVIKDIVNTSDLDWIQGLRDTEYSHSVYSLSFPSTIQ